MKKPITTLFMLESLDGKISSGSSDNLDADKDWCTIEGVKEGLHQYYELETTTDFYSLNTGRVMAKIGVNDMDTYHDKVNCQFVIIDNKPWLNEKGIDYICHWMNKLILITTNKHHVAFSMKEKYDNLEIIFYPELDLKLLLHDLAEKFDVERITIQSGGNLNALFLKEKLIDYVHVVISPLLVGGQDTPTLIDGKSITQENELINLKALKLMKCNVLEDSYIELEYKVINDSITS